jgi:hypothetical protein
MVGISRNTDNRNIILVPCWAKPDESVLINKENEFLNENRIYFFDIHAYEKWLIR